MKQYSFSQSISFSKFFAASLFLSLCVSASSAQQTGGRARNAGAQAGGAQAGKAATPQSQSKVAEGSWRLLASKQTPQTYSLKAKQARVSEIAGELSRRLKVPVTLSPVMEKRRITLDFDALTIDAALRMLAPRPFIDYEADGGGATQPKMLAIYLYAANETPPAASVALRNNSEAIVIEGDTEEGLEESGDKKKEKEEPLVVSFTQNQLSVKAHKQPLTVVLYKIANSVGVPFELRHDSNELIDIEFKGYSIEQAVRALSSSVRFYFRTDLQNFEIQPLRIALVAPPIFKP